MDDQMLLALVELINAEIRLFHRLLELLRQEQGALAGDDLSALDARLGEQQDVAAQARRLEIERLRLVQALSQAVGGRPGRVSMARLVEVLGESGDEELARMRQVLLELGHKVRDTNARNAALIQQSLGCAGRLPEPVSLCGLSCVGG